MSATDADECEVDARSRGMVAVVRYRDVEEVLRRGSEFVIGDSKAASDEFLGGSITTLDGPEHIARRRLLARAIDVRRPWGPFGDLFDATFNRNLGGISRAGEGSDPAFDLVAFARRIVWETVARMIGIDGVEGPEAAALLQSLAGDFINAATVEFALDDPATVVEAGRSALEAVRTRFFLPSFQRRLELVGAGRDTPGADLPGDLITTMILASDGAPDPGLILREAMVFFTASVNNPVNQTPFALQDLEDWLAAHPDDVKQLADDDFYSRCAQETLRLHRTGNPYLLRRASTDATLKSGLAVRAGDRLGLYLAPANLDEAVFGPDATRFNPGRTFPPGVPPFGLAFGAGPHMCIGRPMLVYELGAPIRLGLQARMLRALVTAGVRPDPHGPRTKASHAADRYASFGALIGAPLTERTQHKE